MPCLCDSEIQAVIEKMLDMSGVQYCMSDTRADYSMDEFGVEEYIISNPQCTTSQDWTSTLIRVCPVFSAEVIGVRDIQAEINKLFQIMAVAEPDQCSVIYKAVVTNAQPELCDLMYKVIVERNEEACKIVDYISAIASSGAITPEECEVRMNILVKELKCDVLPDVHVTAIQCGVSPEIIVGLDKCSAGLWYKDSPNGPVPVVRAYGQDIAVAETCQLFSNVIVTQ